MKIAITGSSGLVGTALRREIAARGWSVTRVVRPSSQSVRSSPSVGRVDASGGLTGATAGATAGATVGSSAGSVAWDPAAGTIDAAGLEGHDVVLHTAGESLFGVWSAAKKRRIEGSRVRGTELLAHALAGLDAKPKVLVSWSGSDYYGDRDPAVPLAEDARPGTGFLARTCVRWESAARPAADAGIRLVTLRSALVLSTAGGPLAVMLPFFRLGLGATLGHGRQPWPWLTLDELVAIVMHAIETEDLAGPVNAVAPGRVDNERFSRALAAAVGRPLPFRIPEWLLRLAPGGMGRELFMDGAPLAPRRLEDTGYRFRWPALEPALAHMLGG